MKYSLVFSLVLAGVVAFSPVSQAGSRENKRLQGGKITKNEAEHLVLKQYPGATITKCILKSAGGQDIWMVELTRAGSQGSTSLRVDGRTGKIVP